MTLLYAATSFFGALLLFFVEPLVGRLLLPVLGGSPAVWGACVVFFQAALLAGYAWAHVLASRAPLRVQPFAHALALGACALALPLRAPDARPPAELAFPTLWVLAELARLVGPPFFAIAATGPLVQRWAFGAGAKNPYALFAASNAGSLLALVAYPALVEPALTLHAQRALWSWGYALLIALTLALAVFARARTPAHEPTPTRAPAREPTPARAPASPWRHLGLAAAPSALMLGATTYVTTDVAPMPLLWVVPLALYLASMALPFLDRPPIAHDKVMRALPAAILVLGFTLLVGADRLVLLGIAAHFGSMFVVALACHGELARTRPPARALTGFYLRVSLGGALGGLFAAIAAPVAFPAVWEYPLAAWGAALLRVGVVTSDEPDRHAYDAAVAELEGRPAPRRRARWVRPVVVAAALFAGLVLALRATLYAGDDLRRLALAQAATVACVLAWWWRRRAWTFALLSGALLAAPEAAALGGGALFRGRSFFATHRVALDPDAGWRMYVQGTTIHGVQSVDPKRARVAGAYYHATGPAGDVLDASGAGARPARVGLVGLGVGSLATYAEPGQRFTFYEIDPVVARIAEDPRLFSFVPDARARGARVDVVLGDARLSLESAEDASFDLLVLDAYSSDVVPTHLLTREAFALYLRKLAPDGRVLMNVSNRYLDLGCVVRALAEDARLDAAERLDEIDTPEDRRAQIADGKAASRWILLARSPSTRPPGWVALAAAPTRPWTDDYASVLSAIR